LPKIDFSENGIKKIGDIVSLYGNSVLWVHGRKSFMQSSAALGVEQNLKSAGMTIYKYEIPSEPSPAMIDNAVTMFANNNISVVLSIGGGSVIDAGKAISAMLPLAEPVASYLEIVGTKQHPGCKIPFIAVPTTSGAGTEATFNAVLSEVGATGFKRSLRHENLMPNVAIIDPSLMLSCPPQISAACGMDALTQLIEAYTSTKANVLTDALAISGLTHMSANLIPACTTHTHDASVRGHVAWASFMSGAALANAGLGVVHGFASSVGARFPIPHGVVCGTLLASCVCKTIYKLRAENPQHTALDKYATVGNILCGKSGATVQDSCNMLIDKLEEFTRELNMPRLAEFGVTKADFDAIAAETGNKYNPVSLDNTDLKKILLERL